MLKRNLFGKTNIMYVPALALFAVFVVYPFFEGIRIALTNWNGFSRHFDYIGFTNFRLLVTDSNVHAALFNTLLYGFGSTLFQQVIGLAYALLLNGSFRGRIIGRTVIYLPALISGVIMGYMWYYILAYDGALNDVLALFGADKKLWLSQAGTAIALIININTLQYVGVSMIIYLAGLQNIPAMYYEAADLDGAGTTARFFSITLPLLYPAIVTSVTINLIGGLKLFDVIRALTGGGPGYTTHSLATLIYTAYFGSQMAGYAAAIGLLLFGTILAFTILLQYFSRNREVQY